MARGYCIDRASSRNRRCSNSINTFTDGFLAGRMSRFDPFARIPALVPFSRRPLSPFNTPSLLYHWLLAETHVLAHLRAGTHPLLIQQYAEERIPIALDADTALYYRSVARIIENLMRAGRFGELLDLQAYLLLRGAERLRFVEGVRVRFWGFSEVEIRGWGRDEEIMGFIARSRALDDNAERELRLQKERQWAEAEAKYQETETILRAEIEDLKRQKPLPQTPSRESNDRRHSRSSVRGSAIYPGRDGEMPRGYYGAQMTSDPEPEVRRSSSHSRYSFGERVLRAVGSSYSPGLTSPRREHGSSTRRIRRVEFVETPSSPSRSKTAASEAEEDPSRRTANWAHNNAIPIPPSERSYSHNTTTGSTQRPRRDTHRGGPPVSTRGWDKVWSQTPSIFRSERRSHGHNYIHNHYHPRSQSQTRPEEHFSPRHHHHQHQRGRTTHDQYAAQEAPPRTRASSIDNPTHRNFSRPRRADSLGPADGYRTSPVGPNSRNGVEHGRSHFAADIRDTYGTNNHHVQGNGFVPGFAETIYSESTQHERERGRGRHGGNRTFYGRDDIAPGFVESIRRSEDAHRGRGRPEDRDRTYYPSERRRRSTSRFAESIRSFGSRRMRSRSRR